MTNNTLDQINVEDNILEQLINSRVRHIPLKRIFDIIFSCAVLILLSPVFIVIAMFIRLSTKGPATYSHKRIGRGGRAFRCYKFCTMYPDAEMRLKEILEACPEKRREWEESYKLKNDPRVTPIGSFLRKTSLDELPQFWNVFRGDLSIVGPRPVVKEEVVKFMGEKAVKILSVRPGLTGIWQVNGRSDTNYSKRVQLDELYVDERSHYMDLKLILKTIPSMIFSKGAY